MGSTTWLRYLRNPPPAPRPISVVDALVERRRGSRPGDPLTVGEVDGRLERGDIDDLGAPVGAGQQIGSRDR